RGLARARWAAQELERALRQMKRDVAEDFRSHPVSQADILEANHWNSSGSAAGVRVVPRWFAAMPRPPTFMVKGRLRFTGAGGRGSEALIICGYLVGKAHGQEVRKD